MSRRLARELALKALYQHDLVGADPRQALDHLCAEEAAGLESRRFAADLVSGVLDHRKEIDEHIAAYARDWRLERIAPVDRNILRLGIYEILHRPDVPTGVAINEAVELAKTYAEEESGRFINGILGQLARTAGVEARGGRDAGGGEPAGEAEAEEGAGDSGDID